MSEIKAETKAALNEQISALQTDLKRTEEAVAHWRDLATAAQERADILASRGDDAVAFLCHGILAVKEWKRTLAGK